MMQVNPKELAWGGQGRKGERGGRRRQPDQHHHCDRYRRRPPRPPSPPATFPPPTATTSGDFRLRDFRRDPTPPRCWNWLENAARDNKKTCIMPQPIHVVAITVNILMMLQTSSSVDANDDEDEDEEETGSEEEEEEEDGSMRTMIVRVVIVVFFIFIFCSQLKGEDKCNAHIMVFVSGRLCITLIILVNAKVCSIYFLLLSWFF
ncbi:uncharacterized protein LOC131321062 [Rhododendron vialii]|uniref:uncharacterized protein LOC131321062 n=1 Tax=Rhododendron vialii TaxID=182163 RepID=UPI00265F0AED|nr:uncharacterized protein LOC131321062 [Rhododendron vialii]